MKSEKVLGYEEWKQEVSKRKHWYHGFDLARQGMYTLEEAQAALVESGKVILVPDVSEWPESSEGILVVHTGKGEPEIGSYHYIKYIPRPAPAWEPKVGDAVFYKSNENLIGVDKISNISKEKCKNVYWITSDTDYGFYEIKPFDPAKIGLKWEEI